MTHRPDQHTGESDGPQPTAKRDPKAGDKLLAASRREKAKLTKIRDTITILSTLFVVAMFVIGGLFVALTTDGAGDAPAMRVEMWCTGYASGFTKVMMRSGISAPYSNEWERLIQECVDGIFYLEPYPVLPGISPPNPIEIFRDDVAPDDGFCIPSILRQC